MKKAPWTAEEVARLNEYQACPWAPVFTCGGDRHDEAHRAYQALHGGDHGQLVATEEGWVCPVCHYGQDWAHEFMFEGAPPHPFAKHLS